MKKTKKTIYFCSADYIAKDFYSLENVNKWIEKMKSNGQKNICVTKWISINNNSGNEFNKNFVKNMVSFETIFECGERPKYIKPK